MADIKSATDGVEDLRARVLSGELDKEQVLLSDELFQIYARHKRVIDDAFDAYGRRQAIRVATKLRNGECLTDVIYVHGIMNHDGPILEDLIAQGRTEGEEWSACWASGAYPLNRWRGEEILFLDDLGASVMDATDWLSLFAPNSTTLARARRYNKQAVAPRVIVMTSRIELEEYLHKVRKRGYMDETLKQFIRHLKPHIREFDDSFWIHHFPR